VLNRDSHGYGNCLTRLGEYKRLFVFNADLEGACGTSAFCKNYPERAATLQDRRSINLGVQECNMMSMAAGMASCGKSPSSIPLASSQTGAHGNGPPGYLLPSPQCQDHWKPYGTCLGEYGVSHQATEDVGVMRCLPNIVVIEPSDAVQADKLSKRFFSTTAPSITASEETQPPLSTSSNDFGSNQASTSKLARCFTQEVRTGRSLPRPVLCEVLKVARWRGVRPGNRYATIEARG